MNLERTVKFTLWMGLALLLMLTIGCGRKGTNTVTEYVSCSVTETAIVCPDGTSTPLPSDGQDGIDGKTPIIAARTVVLANQCTEVSPGIYVENIQNGKIFDVYHNDQCADAQGEYCDNVSPSFGSSGQFGPGQPGGGDICWAENLMVSGSKDGNDLIITVIDFTESL